MRIELVIDELRLHGFDPHSRHAVADAIEREATALTVAQLSRLAALDSIEADAVDGGTLAVSPEPGPLGQAIARAVIATVVGRAGAEPGAESDRADHAAAPEILS